MAKIFIDPGHGGGDSGAIGNGLKEKDVVLKIAKKLRDILKNEYGANVKMSRTTDKFLSLRERTNMANAWGADYFVSIHTNAGGGKGYEDFIYNGVSNNSTAGKYREKIHQEVAKRINMNNRGKKKANFHVLRESKMPAILTENGFIDNKHDTDLMKKKTWINDVARGHAIGIAKAFGLKKVKDTKKENKTVTTKTHTVKKGDTLYSIAKKYGTTVKKLKELNPKVVPEKLQIGEKIKVQGNATKKKTIPKKKYLLPSGVIGRGATGEKVRQIQEALVALHFYPNKQAKNKGIDSIYGKDTANAVRRFQSVYVGEADGTYGPNTKKALEKELKRRGLK